jgi:signal transduction histidine kinase/CheY-like chemotaxis protein
MTTIPLSVVKYIRSVWMAEMILAYLQIDEQGNLVKWGGHPRHYGLSNLTAGQPVVEQVNFLEGMLTIPHSHVLEFVRVGEGRCAHVHIIPLDKGTYVLMLDATGEHDRQQKMQQQLNELSILTYRQSQLLQELEAARQALREEKEQLGQASELKSQFITTLSHELRTPLTSIVGYAKLLDEAKQADSRSANYLTTVKNNANHLLLLIDNVLEQTTLEAGQTVLQSSRCDIKQLLTDLKSLFFPNAKEKKLVFDVEMQPNLPTQVTIDELRFRQVLINLITNAFKFTSNGFVRVIVGWQAERLEFSVADSGSGVSPEAQPKIFTAFHREHTNNATPGTGLGLAISHHLVTLMGGNLAVESSPGHGSVFYGFIQAPITDSLSLHDGESVFPHTSATILIADDSIDVRYLMEIYLEEDGYAVVGASDGAEAIILANQVKPDLILMDMQMPVTNGYEAVQQLRADNFTKPIIALSGSSLAHDCNYALEVGCDQYMVKPVSPDNLLKTIKQVLNKTNH